MAAVRIMTKGDCCPHTASSVFLISIWGTAVLTGVSAYFPGIGLGTRDV